MKKKSSTITAIIILIILPLAAITVLYMYSQAGFRPEKIVNVSLTTDEKTIEYTDAEDIKIFANAVVGGGKITSPMRDISEYTSIDVVFDQETEKYPFTFLLSTSSTDCLYLDRQGQYYVMDSESASEILKRNDMQFIYEYSQVPNILFTSPNQELNIIPIEYTWEYENIDGQKFADSGSLDDYTKSVGSLPCIVGASTAAFSVKPDSLSLSVCKKGESEPIFTSSTLELSKLRLDKDTPVTVYISAEWQNSAKKNYRGKATYQFDALYDAPAIITVSQNSSNSGELVLITAENTTEEDLSVSATFETTSSPVFYEINSVKYCLLPISASTAPGEYDIIVSSKKNTELFKAKYTVTESTAAELNFSSADMGVSAEEFNTGYKQAEAVFDSVSKETASSPLWSNAGFSKPMGEKEGYMSGGFRSARTIDGTNIPALEGAYFKAGENVEVTAAAAGKVVFVGKADVCGTAVILDHGLGLRSYYCNLADTAVNEGDEISSGALIGHVGTSGAVSSARTEVRFSVGGVYINPSSVYVNYGGRLPFISE